MSLVADSDFLIALYKQDDANHQRALKLAEKIVRQKESLVLSVFVYAETATMLTQKVSPKTGAHFIRDIESQRLPVLQSNRPWFERAKNIFSRQSSKNVSFVDATNIALVGLIGSSSIVSFDKDYQKNGVPLFR